MIVNPTLPERERQGGLIEIAQLTMPWFEERGNRPLHDLKFVDDRSRRWCRLDSDIPCLVRAALSHEDVRQ